MAHPIHTVTAPFQVVHPEIGVVLLDLSLAPSGAVLTLNDSDGRPRVKLSSCPDAEGAAVEVCRPDGRAVAALLDFGAAEGGALALTQPDSEDVDDTLALRTLTAAEPR